MLPIEFSFSKKETPVRVAKKPESCFAGHRSIKQKCPIFFVTPMFRLTITRRNGICGWPTSSSTLPVPFEEKKMCTSFVSFIALSRRSKNRGNEYGIPSSSCFRAIFTAYLLLPRQVFSAGENALFVLPSSKVASNRLIVTENVKSPLEESK